MLKNTSRLHLNCLLFAVIIMLMMPFLTGFDITRSVIVRADGQEKTIKTNVDKPERIIKEAGFTLEAGDGWRLHGANKNIQDGSIIEVVRAMPVIIVRGGESKTYKSSRQNVGAALKNLGISFDKTKVYPDVASPLKADMKIYVLEKGEELTVIETDQEPPVQYVDDRNLASGREVVKNPGKNGKVNVISKHTKNKGGIKEHVELGREVTVMPEPKVISKGTALSVKTPEGYKRYTRSFIAHTSAYVATGNRTAIGLVPYEGIVAVDPNVIPFYTKLYIPGYGIGMAGDTGGAIRGNCLDLFFHSYNKAIQWGRRDIEVYILED